MPKSTKSAGIIPDGTSDNTGALQQFLDDNAGLACVISGNANPYITGRLKPSSDTTIVFESSVTFQGKAGDSNVLRLENVSGVHILGNGATLSRGPTSTSSAVYFASAHHCSISDLAIEESGSPTSAGKDCVYIGSAGLSEFSSQITLNGLTCTNAKRNCISIVAGKGVLLNNCVTKGAVDAPAAGIDVEANEYGVNSGMLINECTAYENGAFGAIVAFGDDIEFDGFQAYDNGAGGLGLDLAGLGLAYEVMRSNVDSFAIGDFDTATGNIRISGTPALEVGVWGQFIYKPGATASVPVTLQSQTRWMVAEIDEVFGTIKLSANVGDPVTSFSDKGSGVLSLDPKGSEIVFAIYGEGCSNIRITGGHIRDNGNRSEVQFGACYDVFAKDVRVDAGLDRVAFGLKYARGVVIDGVGCSGNASSTGGFSRGINVGACTNVSLIDNDLSDFAQYGIYASQVLGFSTVGESFINCGFNPTGQELREVNTTPL